MEIFVFLIVNVLSSVVPTDLLGKTFCDTLLTQRCTFMSRKKKLRSYKAEDINLVKSFCSFWRRCRKDEKLRPSSTGCWRLVPAGINFPSPPITAYCTFTRSTLHITLSINRKINWKFIPNFHFNFTVWKSLLLIILFLQTQVLHEDPLHANYIPILQWHYSFSDESRWIVYEQYSWIKIQRGGKLHHVLTSSNPSQFKEQVFRKY